LTILNPATVSNCPHPAKRGTAANSAVLTARLLITIEDRMRAAL
jgi:hypothetical protein